MGQKVNPHGLRVGVIKNWDSRWIAADGKVGDLILEDYKIREFLKKKLYSAGIPDIEIERTAEGNSIRIFLHCAKPGLVIGRGGAEIEKLKKELMDMTGKKVNINIVEVKNMDTSSQLVAESIAQQLEKRIAFRRAMKKAIGNTMRTGAKGIKIMVSGRLNGAEIEKLKAELCKMTGKKVNINIVEVKNVDTNSQLVAENIAQQLEKRIAFRRATKQAIGRTMKTGAKGIKVMVAGRLNGAEIARSESYHEGTIPLQTLRADIDYGFAEANTTYGKIGVKVWIYKGEVLNVSKKASKKEGGSK